MTAADDGVRDIIALRIPVPPSCDGWRLDHFLKFRIGRLSRTRIQRILEEQISFADGRKVRASSRVRSGEIIHLDRPAPVEPDVPREFAILAEDDGYIAIDKPAGLPIHTTAKFIRNTLTAVLRERYPGQPLQVCHRLDRETSGVLLIARNRAAARKLKMAFEHREIDKTYRAIVHGIPSPELTLIDMPIALLDTKTHMVMGPTVGGLSAQTEIAVEQAFAGHALVRCHPLTGRQHQIRVHLAASGHPIMGDKIYRASEEEFMAFCDHGMTPELLERFDGLQRHALHAASLTFPHPTTGKPVTVNSPLPADLQAVVDSLANPQPQETTP